MDIDWPILGLSVGLLILAVALLILELFVVSFGMLLIASIASTVAAIHYAFAATAVAGWTMAVIVPVVAVALVRWGLAGIRESRRMVTKSEITSDAGYRHHAQEVGVHPGAEGVMVTRAQPSGRARFAGGECDVQVQSGSLGRGEKIVVLRIDGPIVFVTPAVDSESHDITS